MPRGDKGHYTAKQGRQARHITESFVERGFSKRQATGRAWATVNAIHGGGELPGGGGCGKTEDKEVYRRGGRRADRTTRRGANRKVGGRSPTTAKPLARSRRPAAGRTAARGRSPASQRRLRNPTVRTRT